MRTAKVAVVKGQTPELMVKRSLELIDANELIASNDRVLIKPNYICAKHPSTGVTTDSQKRISSSTSYSNIVLLKAFNCLPKAS